MAPPHWIVERRDPRRPWRITRRSRWKGPHPLESQRSVVRHRPLPSPRHPRPTVPARRPVQHELDSELRGVRSNAAAPLRYACCRARLPRVRAKSAVNRPRRFAHRDWEDRGTAILFGDGAGSCCRGSEVPATRSWGSAPRSYASSLCRRPLHDHMDGKGSPPCRARDGRLR